MSEQKQKGITRETLKFVFKTAWKERPSVFLVSSKGHFQSLRRPFPRG